MCIQMILLYEMVKEWIRKVKSNKWKNKRIKSDVSFQIWEVIKF